MVKRSLRLCCVGNCPANRTSRSFHVKQPSLFLILLWRDVSRETLITIIMILRSKQRLTTVVFMPYIAQMAYFLIVCSINRGIYAIKTADNKLFLLKKLLHHRFSV